MQIVQQQMPELATTMVAQAQEQATAYTQYQEALANLPPPAAPKPKPLPKEYEEVCMLCVGRACARSPLALCMCAHIYAW
jgi:hypothetical protein